MLLEGKIALITGATGAIGRAIATKYLENGAHLAMHYHSNEKKAKELHKQMSSYLGESIIVKADLTKYDEVQRMMQQINDRFGHLDILVNNAGVAADKLITLMSDKEWDDVLDLNLNGTFYTTQTAIPLLAKSKNGRIVNISSVTGICGQVTRVNYGTSKAAIIGLTRALSKELAKYKIHVNTVAPAIMDSGIAEKLPFLQKQIHKGMTPLRRLGTADDVANAVLYLTSEMSDYITGEIITVSGGEVSWYL